jgi:hypothetical protein
LVRQLVAGAVEWGSAAGIVSISVGAGATALVSLILMCCTTDASGESLREPLIDEGDDV